MRYTVNCPKCGAIQKGLDLKETSGWVVCYECDTKFTVDKEELKGQTKKDKTAE